MKKVYLLILLVVVHGGILSVLQFTAWPEMVSFPYFINEGFVTYKDAIHAYPSLAVNTLAVLYKIFGYHLWVLKAFGWGVILTGDILIFLIIKKLTKKENLALGGVLTYVVLQPFLEGNMVWPDLTIVPFLLLTFLLLLNKKYFWSGVVMGLGLMIKQTGIVFVLVSLTYLVFGEKKLQRISSFILGGGVVILPFLMSLVLQKSFGDFLNWTITYPSYFWTKFPGYVQLSPSIREDVTLLILFLPLAILIAKAKKEVFDERSFLVLFGFLVGGIVGVYPRFSFFHFQGALAFLIISYFYLVQSYKKRLVFLILIVPVIILAINFRSVKFGEARFWGQSDIELGEAIQAETKKGEVIYLLGVNSNIYTLSERLPNKPWLDNFGWYLEIPGVQEKVITSFKENPPGKVFWQMPEDGNWYDIGTYQPEMISKWIEENYIREKEVGNGIWEWKLK